MSELDRPLRARRRPAISCEECRRRKIKCDRAQPCKHCRQINALCSYSNGAAPLQHKAALASTHRIAEPPTPTSVISNPASTHGSLSIRNEFPQQLPQNSWNSFSTREEDAQESPKVRALMAKVQRMEQLLMEYMPKGVLETSISPTPLEPRAQLRGTLSKTRLFGQTHWMNFIGLFDTIADKTPDLSTPSFNNAILETNVPALLKRCKAMAKASKIRIYGEWLANPNIRDFIPPPEICEILLDAYFRTSESAFRIFHIPTFRKEYAQYRREPLLASDSFILKMLLAMAIGTMFYQEADFEKLREQAKIWVYATQSWLSEIPYEKSRLNIVGLQIHCLLLLARQSLAVVDDQVWISTGSLVRRAISIGLHRDPKYLPNVSVLQAEIRRRLWATIVELNIQFSVEAGMRPLISLDDFDTEPPANINDEDIAEDTSSPPVSKPSSVFTQTSIQIILLSSLKTRMEVLQLCNSLNTEPSYEEASKLGEMMTKECRVSSSFVRNLQSSKADLRPTQLQCNVLDIYLRRFILILYSIFATKPQSDPRHYFSRKTALDASVTMLSYASSSTPSGLTPSQSLHPPPYDDYTCLRTRTGGFFENIITHSMIMIFYELVTQLKDQASNPSTPLFLAQTKSLKNILYDAREVIKARIKVAENNVKGHLLFSAALGQIEAMEAGTSPYQGAVEGAKRSAEMCFGLLAEKEEGLVPGAEAGDGVRDGMGFDMEDWGVDFVMPDAWLFSGWEGCVVDNQIL